MAESFPIRFGRYELVERLALGGMAELFLATVPGEHGFAKHVVIKRLLPHLAREPGYTAMFIDEAKLTAKLVHPKIAQTFELGRVGDQLFIAMEMVDGVDVLALLREFAQRHQRLPTEVSVWIAHEVLDALDYAHGLAASDGKPLGVVHRDISPSNVLLSRRGDVKLVDFGIARASEPNRHHRTKSGTLKGKYGYMSPEQVLEHPVDARSDIFSVGIVLAEMLMGRRLFAAPNELDVLLMVRDARLSRLDEHGAHLERELDGILRKALRKEPDARWKTAGEMRDALDDWLFQQRVRITPKKIGEVVDAVYDAVWTRRRTAASEPELPAIEEVILAPPGAPGAPRASTSAEAPRALRGDADGIPIGIDSPGDSLPIVVVEETPEPLEVSQPPQRARPVVKIPPKDGVPPPSRPGHPVARVTPKAVAVPRAIVERAKAEPVSPMVPADEDVERAFDDLQVSSAPRELAPGLLGEPGMLGDDDATTDRETPGDPFADLEIEETTPVRERRASFVQSAAPEQIAPGRSMRYSSIEAAVSALSRKPPDPSTIDLDGSLVGGGRRPTGEIRAITEDDVVRAANMPPPELAADIEESPEESGDFAATPPLRVLYKYLSALRTGLLVARVGGITKEIYVRDGMPEYVSSNVSSELFGNWLVSQGVLSQGELAMALAMMPHYGGKLGDTLVGLGLLKPLEVFRHLTRQVRSKLIDVCTWSRGSFSWYAHRTNEREAFPLDLNAFEVLGAGAMALSDGSVKEWLARWAEVRLRATKAGKFGPDRFEIPGLRAVYDGLDGRKSVGEILARYTDDEEQQRAVRMLMLLEMCEMARAA